jgi:carbonic anhydrase/acetyltransferase-like protein (isoleucine patch superfamily)
MALILPYAGRLPRIEPGAWVAPNATLIGDVTLLEGASVWFGAVLRGDVGPIVVGRRSNIQDLVCVHATEDLSTTTIGDEVTVGHGAVIHGCRIGDGVLVGMGAIVLDNAEIGNESLLAAGALVTPRTVVAARSLVRGNPAKWVREVSDAEGRLGRDGAAHYVAKALAYRAALEGGAS